MSPAGGEGAFGVGLRGVEGEAKVGGGGGAGVVTIHQEGLRRGRVGA